MSSSPATVVRVKRKRTEDPASALVLSFKRSRGETSSDSDDVANEIFRLTGTMPAGEDSDGSSVDTREQLKRVLGNGGGRVRPGDRRSYKLHVADVRLKCRKEKEESARQQRRDLLLSLRQIEMQNPDRSGQEAAGQSHNAEPFDASDLPHLVLDDEGNEEVTSRAGITCNDHPLLRVKQPSQAGGSSASAESGDTDYVFDIYIPSLFCDEQTPDESGRRSESPFLASHRKRTSSNSSISGLDVSEYFNNLVAVYPYNLCEEAIDNGADVDSFHVTFGDSSDNDEDSNAETNWRNEYPDEDDEFESRYDFYDQNYPASDGDEAADDGVSVTEHMRGLGLGTNENEPDDDDDFG